MPPKTTLSWVNIYNVLPTQKQKNVREKFCAFFNCSDTTFYNRINGKSANHISRAETEWLNRELPMPNPKILITQNEPA